MAKLKNLPILNPTVLAGYPSTSYIMHYTSTSRKGPAYTPQRSDLLSPGSIFMSLMRVRGVLREANCGPTCSKAISPQRTSTPEERAKMGRYGTENGPAKTASHLS